MLMVEMLNNAGRLLTDLHHDKGVIRASLILANQNTFFKGTLSAMTLDVWLFGNQLDEKLKETKALGT